MGSSITDGIRLTGAEWLTSQSRDHGLAQLEHFRLTNLIRHRVARDTNHLHRTTLLQSHNLAGNRKSTRFITTQQIFPSSTLNMTNVSLPTGQDRDAVNAGKTAGELDATKAKGLVDTQKRYVGSQEG
jgi:hypothetical protein